ncbi:caspase family protein [Bradyrhizobium sp.]|uniref:caspase family protein n=1 Tax=Bradyrhizobium sp. TaxID=376 RepID=UPI0023A714B9|nr:caspase family protein [Bradyrhizobium sp.]MDE2378854.1 caspase family protein [Bradyrhizobium sp.]
MATLARHLVALTGFVVLLALACPRQGEAQPGDYGACVALQYDRLRTEKEIAATIAACTRVLQDPSAGAEQRAYALYFRALNHFLETTRLALAEMKPIGSAGEAAQRELKTALDDLAACIAAAPTPHPQPFSLRATIYTTLDRFDEALADLARAIRADPGTSHHFVQRALILERLDRFSEARADLDAAVERDPPNQNAWINRAMLWARYGDVERALADYDKAEAVGGSQTWYALSGRARLAVSLGEPVRGFADWTRAAEATTLPMQAAQFHVRAGNLARDYLKDIDKARQSYARALAVAPGYADALIQRGIAFERAGRLDDAANDYRKAGDLTRGNPLDKSIYDYSVFRLDVLRARLSRKAGDPPLPPNINVLSASSATIGKERGRRVALVLGNAAYEHVTPLLNSDRDAESVGAALNEAGFARVTVATNLDRNQMEGVLRQFATEAAGADWALVYYAGHGVEIDGINYAIPIDASMDTLREAGSNAISIDRMISAVDRARQLHLVVLDACRDDPFVQQAHRAAARKRTFDKSADAALDPLIARRKEIGGGLSSVRLAQANTVALFSTQPGQVTLDGDELNSPFTRAFVSNLPTPRQDLRLFLDRVRQDVSAGTQGRQRPAFDGRLKEGEQFFFFPAP